MSKKSRPTEPTSGGSDQDEAVLDTLGKDLDARGGSLSPFGSQPKGDLDFFPLAKGEKEGKKLRRYRGTSELDKVPEREHSRERRKHRSEKERKKRPVSPPSSHKSHSGGARRAGRASGRASPHGGGFEGRRSRSQERQRGPSWDREREREQGYRLDRDEGYRRSGGEHSRYQKDHHEGRRGTGAPPTSDRLPAPRAYREEKHRQRSRSPLRRGRDEYSIPRGRGSHAHRHHGNEPIRRSPLEAHHHLAPSDLSSGSEEEEEEGEEMEVLGGRLTRHRPRDESGESSDISESDHESERERRGRLKRKRGIERMSLSPGSSSSGSEDSEKVDATSRSKSGSSSPDQHSKAGDKLSLPHVIRSRFDSDEEDELSGEELRERAPASRLFTGYQETSSEEEKHQPTADEQEKKEDGKKEEEAVDVRELQARLMAELDSDPEEEEGMSSTVMFLPALMGCRNVESFEWLNRIEEGTYGVVHRARDKKTGEIVALKKLKMEKEREGFPITSLREINTLLKAKHPNVVHVKEIVVGSNMDKIFIVMEYVEHDLKALMETMTQPFLQGEVKTLLIQLLRAVHHLHDNWILHRDLKASNLLLSHKGILKVGDFGLAREYGSPLKNYTPIVVTLWYRPPELLLGAKEYSTAVDMWSVGCIFAEFLLKEPLFKGRSEIDQINQIFKQLGTPNERIWPGYNKLPATEKVTFTNYPYNNLRKKFPPTFLTESGFNLLNRFLTYDPKKRISAQEALGHKYFNEPPMPVPPSMFPTWPAKSEMGRGKRREKSPKPPEGGVNTFLGEDEKPAAPFTLK